MFECVVMLWVGTLFKNCICDGVVVVCVGNEQRSEHVTDVQGYMMS